MPIIHVEDLVKEFRRPKKHDGAFSTIRTLFTRQYTINRAVNGVSFDVEPGELVGYLGPNGAGKSTTIKMLTGILEPTAGTVSVAGVTPWRQREKNARQIGVVFGQRSQLWWDLPLRDSLWLIGKLYDMPRELFEARQRQFTELLALGPFLDTPVRQLSLGQRMRGDLAAAMLYAPKILYLDEPTVGLDVVAKEAVRTFVRELNKESGTTVILTTHDLDDVEQLCERVVLIDQGSVMYDGSIDTLRSRYAPYRELVVHTDGQVSDLPGATVTKHEDGRVWLRFDPQHTTAADLIGSLLARHTVSDLSITEPQLESVIRNIYADRR
ncbi:methionine ABC transporter ATP-binding protein [Streptomyces sp. NRRL WC-3618]|uniref:ABC transporter ATP-binding protein n=1 Tax=Streptomyces sp. NRRL WC-3618 TaxID=1519490 RepID=UPI0006AD991F|nr:ATP-binding cassette domain-containing protein [Streptomyces sp. NRRL WC-3618]KOV88536.1 methionine ABC transporter ATP-binding protein [Streptomyces sp. NRRL WC-3618]